MKRPLPGTLFALSTAIYALLWLGVLVFELILKISKEQALALYENPLGEMLLPLALSIPLLVVALFFGVAVAATAGTWKGGATGRAALAFGIILDVVLIVMAILVYSMDIEELRVLKPMVTLPFIIGISVFGLIRILFAVVAFRDPFYPKAVD